MNNFRDIGYGNVRKGMLFRGCALNELSPEDKAIFNESGICTIVDLRSPQEVAEQKDTDLSGVINFNIPLLSIEEMSVMVEGQFPDVRASYRTVVNRGKQEVWTRIFDLLLDRDGAVMFHCTQGKDRTGILVAIVLSALGVNMETIIEDYLKTNDFATMPEEYRVYCEKMPKDIQKLFRALFYVDKDFLMMTFQEIDKQFGSLEGFFRDCCSLDANKLALLRQKYLTL